MGESDKVVPVWQLWDNPIFRRYLRSRLRAKALVPWMLVVGIFTAFIVLLMWVGGTRAGGLNREIVARGIFVILVPIQSVLLLLVGTGSVASGIMLEGSDGGIDYQRLTPLPPLTKIVGYLFGLPVREYCLFLVTVPFSLIALVIGRVPLELVVPLYIAFFTAALLYHLSGCVAGMVVNHRFAARTAQFMVLVLYLVLPQIAKLGFEFFSYLTILPVFSELISGLNLPASRGFNATFGTGSRSVSLFGMELEALPFTLLIQGSLIVTFVVVLYRKWRQPTHHMLGKNFAAGLCVWIHLLLLGSSIPLIETGEIFPAEPRVVRVQREARLEAERFERRSRGIEETAEERARFRRELTQRDPTFAYGLASSYGFGALILSCGLILIITPSRDEFTKGLRRARKLGMRKVPWNADGASALKHTVIIGLTGVVAWTIFSYEMFGSDWFDGARVGGEVVDYSATLLQAVPVTQLLFLVCFWAVLEFGGRSSLLIHGLFAWIVPVMGAMILLFADENLHRLAILVGGLSGIPSPFYAMSLPFNHPSWVYHEMSQIFALSTVIYAILAVLLYLKLSRRHKVIIAHVESGSHD